LETQALPARVIGFSDSKSATLLGSTIKMSPAIQTVDVQTSLGVVPVTGNFDRPLKILAITGMLAVAHDMERFPVAVAPRYSGAVARLPGHGGPQLSQTSIGAFARAFDEVVEFLGPTIVVGLSVGALVSLAMRAPSIRRVVAVEPPLETAKLWQMGQAMAATFADHAEFYREVMGFDGVTFTGRCYLDLLENLPRPTDFVVGDKPLFPTRPGNGQVFSMVDEAQRRLIRAARGAALFVAPGAGHPVQRQAGAYLLDVILRACEATEA
jgi:pimeloyl-ACP methyl ester carboxylesterase